MLGSWKGKLYLKGNLLSKCVGLYTLLFGIPELHAHIRARIFKKIFKQINSDRNIEIGCGGA